jgi:hypothetical protein
VVPLLSEVSGVLVVGRLGNTPRAALTRLRDQLDTVQASTVAAVVNHVGGETARTYGYGYGYGRYRRN